MVAAFLFAGGSYYLNIENYLPNAALYGFRIALVIFINWAIVRELHPDAPWAAFVVVGITSVVLFFLPDPDLQMLFFMLLALRLLTRTTGIDARIPDVLLLIIFTAWLLYQGNLSAGVFATAAFWLNSRLPQPQPWHKYIALLLALATTYSVYLNTRYSMPATLSIYINILIITLATGFALFARKMKQVQSHDDATVSPLFLKRINSAQVILLLVVTVFSLWYGDEYFNKLSPVWSAFGGIFIYAAFDRTPSPEKDI